MPSRQTAPRVAPVPDQATARQTVTSGGVQALTLPGGTDTQYVLNLDGNQMPISRDVAQSILRGLLGVATVTLP